MKKVLIVLGIVFLVLIVLAAVGFGFIALKGRTLDGESQDYFGLGQASTARSR